MGIGPRRQARTTQAFSTVDKQGDPYARTLNGDDDNGDLYYLLAAGAKEKYIPSDFG